MSLKPKISLDLIIVGIVSLLLIPTVILFSSTVPRLLLGIPFVLFIPGYALISALFPAKETIKGLERIAYSIALSFALAALLGLLLNYVWEISLYPMLIVLEIEVFLSIAVAILRRYRLPESRRFIFNINWHIPWQGKSVLDKSLVILLVVVVIGAIVTSVFVYNKNIQTYTEFYLLGQNGKADDYPQNMIVGEKGVITLVIVNQERKPVMYRILVQQENGKVTINNETIKETSVSLDNGQEWKGDISFIFNVSGVGQKIAFQLFMGENTEPYLTTYLNVNIASQ